MHAVIHASTSSDRLLLAVSFACFAVAGGATTTIDATVPTLVATAVAIGGVYTLARYAKAVTRRTLAQLSLALWIAFLAVAGLHAVGLGTVGTAVPGPDETIVLSLSAITWGTFLTACGSTAFLAAREYGTSAGAHVEAETSDYSTR
ncbi:hypothetical protein [Natronobacterium gregoryi]|uniref:Uncharacterized protein n=2 Tax=Natronobacterium gregoryi TaxID=44930 RepID=L0AE65_NATGS|nr:hypothetical protein [Natronobacterium gregoryi]AFZ71719.1 hypothetical protein Natgr_0464 [Natronobacterium gregoryi SP2]ELY72709.1 hypothetical protein C490_02703 [Natronobacterium gregoryi SP2]PLK20234.1 hypothetical protein CYV19_10405 [Natronobacterium gregoryi SP2]SFJ26563.1 hypothetical protein SAMN05443661_11959 [Natronobacterium gregoryi]